MSKIFNVGKTKIKFEGEWSKETVFGIRNTIAASPRQFAFLVGHTVCVPEYYCHFISTSHNCLMYFCKGSGWLRHNGVLYHPQEGDLFILHKDSEWEYATDKDDPWELYWLNSEATGENDFMTPLLHYYSLQDTVRIKDSNALPLIKRCFDVLAEKKASQQTSQASFFSAMFQLVEHIKSTSLACQYHSVQEKDAFRMREYINANIESSLTVDEVARAIFRSTRSASAIFKACYGIPLKKYILDTKLAIAAEWLATTARSVSEIAAMLSFCDVYHFSKIFSSRYGKTPLRYRQQKQNKKTKKEQQLIC